MANQQQQQPQKRFKLVYWNTRALAEPIRCLLSFLFTEEEWEEERMEVGPPPSYSKSVWLLEKKDKLPSLPLSNLPYLIDREVDFCLSQSVAIGEYLWRVGRKRRAKEGEREEKEEEEEEAKKAVREGKERMLIGAIFDYWNEMFAVTYCDFAPLYPNHDPLCHLEGEDSCVVGSRFLPILETYKTKTLPTNLKRLEIFFQKNASSSSSSLSHDGEFEKEKGWSVGPLSCCDFFLFEFLDQNAILCPDCLSPFPLLSSFHSRFEKEVFVKHKRSSRYQAEPLHNRYSHFWKGWIKS